MQTDLEALFTKEILGKEHFSEERSLALATLIAKSRKGALCVRAEELPSAIQELPASLCVEGCELFPRAPIIHHNGYYYLQRNWVYESYLLQETQRIRGQKIPSWFDPQIFAEELSTKALLPAQRQALTAASQNGFSIISGGPGTGKTYTATHLVELFASALKPEKKRLRVLLGAPTGKAASHLHSALQRKEIPKVDLEAATLHRLLKLTPGKERLFGKNFLDADLILVDEASMIDLSLMAHLLQAVEEGTFLVLIGDPYQLPPIEGGSLFPEMAKLFGSSLETCLRTEEKELQLLAASIKEADLERFFSLLPAAQIPSISDWIEPLTSDATIDPHLATQHYAKRRILSPLRQGADGIDPLNALLFDQVVRSNQHWAVPILATVNDSWSGLYNGMNGLLLGKGRSSPIAWFPHHTFSSPPPYELALCLSIHKSQGSEYEEVLALFPPGSEAFGREGLYTAITRAKKKLFVSGSPDILRRMMQQSACTASAFAKRFK